MRYLVALLTNSGWDLDIWVSIEQFTVPSFPKIVKGSIVEELCHKFKVVCSRQLSFMMASTELKYE